MLAARNRVLRFVYNFAAILTKMALESSEVRSWLCTAIYWSLLRNHYASLGPRSMRYGKSINNAAL